MTSEQAADMEQILQAEINRNKLRRIVAPSTNQQNEDLKKAADKLRD